MITQKIFALIQDIYDNYTAYHRILTFDDILTVRIADKKTLNKFHSQSLSYIDANMPFDIEVINNTQHVLTVELLNPKDFTFLSVPFTIDCYQKVTILTLNNWGDFNHNSNKILVRVKLNNKKLNGSFTLSEYQHHVYDIQNNESVYEKIIVIEFKKY